ncbi:MAG: 4Fe-4S binding protein [candidate division KSB1 bacterium]|nr:4Fe-4S binding protein [candidate division KSB1 bacterium]
MRTARRISQAIFFLFFLYLFFQAAYPYEPFISSDTLLRFSPLVAITTLLATRQWIGPLVFAFIVLGLSIALGRYFCGWICPLGTTIDAADWLRRKLKRQSQPSRHLRTWKFTMLILLLVAAIFSLQLAWLFDPIVIMTRSFTAALFPIFGFLVQSLFDILIRFGVFQDSLYAVNDFLRESILPLEQVYFQNSVLLLLVLGSILLLTLLARRFWCRYLCPLGALFGGFASLRLTRGITVAGDKCIDCGKCQRECKMDAINDDFRSHSRVECIECMSCISVCPTQAISYRLNFHWAPENLDISRRRFLYSTAGSVITLATIRTAFPNKIAHGAVVRPPGALPEGEFLDRCVRCQACSKICSSTGACLQPALLESGLEGIWSPIVNARHGYCEYNCNLCGQVCPTGAIHPLPLDAKQKMRMGTAYFDKSRCIPWYRAEDCLVCEEHCPLPDKAIKFDIREARAPNGEIRVVKFPYVDESLCIGCGICVTKCPVTGPGGIFLTNALEQRWEENNPI